MNTIMASETIWLRLKHCHYQKKCRDENLVFKSATLSGLRKAATNISVAGGATAFSRAALNFDVSARAALRTKQQADCGN